MTADTADHPKRTTTYRVLLAVVIILGILIVLAFGALVVGAILKLGRPHAPADNFVMGGVTAGLPAGAHITTIETSGNRVVIGVHTQEGDEVDIFDTDTGRPIARIRAAPPEVPK